MQIGVGLTHRPWTTLGEQVELARLADAPGFSSVWVSETWGQDAVGMLGYIAAVTKRIALGAAVVQIPARQPTAMGMAAATMNELSGCRLQLGLGLEPRLWQQRLRPTQAVADEHYRDGRPDLPRPRLTPRSGREGLVPSDPGMTTRGPTRYWPFRLRIL